MILNLNWISYLPAYAKLIGDVAEAVGKKGVVRVIGHYQTFFRARINSDSLETSESSNGWDFFNQSFEVISENHFRSMEENYLQIGKYFVEFPRKSCSFEDFSE